MALGPSNVAMRLNVTFQTCLRFDMDEQPIGSAVGRRIAERLRGLGLAALIPENHEDFAWSIDFGDQPGPYLLVGYVGDEDFQWLAQVYSGIGWFGRLRGRSDQKECESIALALHRALTTDETVTSIRWHDGEFSETGWRSEP